MFARGRLFSDIDMQDRSNVVIVGVDVKRALFPYEDPVDKEVKLMVTHTASSE